MKNVNSNNNAIGMGLNKYLLNDKTEIFIDGNVIQTYQQGNNIFITTKLEQTSKEEFQNAKKKV
ncbi:MAG: hypothetical protein ACHQLA_00080 [Ignavibacteriales bacterium]